MDFAIAVVVIVRWKLAAPDPQSQSYLSCSEFRGDAGNGLRKKLLEGFQGISKPLDSFGCAGAIFPPGQSHLAAVRCHLRRGSCRVELR